ncbi:putative galacturonosyltransferase 6 isoform X1 [Senna tora]|uniref:Putative galacturonosyltransferase 6 isoform X1 n=1 Tax=Senna tora TaxID=362788 RepID=A0A834WGE8_9FABA|nr:putative galacturonosyltransferase 6 isoform X1 [Senna tora]
MPLHFHEASPKPPYKRSDEALHLPSKKTPTSSPTSNPPRRKLSKTSNSNSHPPSRFRIPPPFHEASPKPPYCKPEPVPFPTGDFDEAISSTPEDSHPLFALSFCRNEFVEDLSSITYRTDTLKLNSIEKEDARGLEEPKQVVYKEKDFPSTISYSSKQNNDSEESRIAGYRRFNDDKTQDQQIQHKKSFSMAEEKKKFNETVPQYQNMNPQLQRTKHENFKGENEQPDEKASQDHQTSGSQSQKAINEKVTEIKDQILRARAYLQFAPPSSNSRLVKELKLRIKEMEQLLGEADNDSELSRR